MNSNPVGLNPITIGYSITSAEEDIGARQGVILGRKTTVTQRIESNVNKSLATRRAYKLAALRKAETVSEAKLRERKVFAQEEEFLPDFAEVANSAGFQRLMAQLRRSKHKENYEEVREALEGGAFGDPPTTHAAVVTAIKWLDGQGGNQKDDQGHQGDNSSLRQFLQEYLDELLEEHGPEIRAGYNISRIAAVTQGGKTDRIAALREFYCNAIFGYENDPAKIYRLIMDEFPDDELEAEEAKKELESQNRPGAAEETPIDGEPGLARLEKAIGFLIASLAKELDSHRPSLDPAKLKSVMDGMYLVEVLRNTYRSYFQMLKKMNQDYDERILIVPGRLMEETLRRIHTDLINDDEFLRIAEALSVPPLEASIYFLTRVLETVRSFPPKLFPSPEDQSKLMMAVQQGLDLAIARETEVAA